MIRHRTPGFLCVCLVAATTACHAPGEQAKPAPARESSDARVRALADAYLAGYFDRNPDGVTLYGIPGRHHDKLPDNSLDALKAWEAKEDSWLAQIKQLDPATIDAAPLRGTAPPHGAQSAPWGPRLAALLLAQIFPISSVVAPCQPGASAPSVRRRIYETDH